MENQNLRSSLENFIEEKDGVEPSQSHSLNHSNSSSEKDEPSQSYHLMQHNYFIEEIGEPSHMNSTKEKGETSHLNPIDEKGESQSQPNLMHGHINTLEEKGELPLDYLADHVDDASLALSTVDDLLALSIEELQLQEVLFSTSEALCNICMESKLRSEFFNVKNCHHAYCGSCIGQYIETRVEENSVLIKCPDPGCKDGFLDPDTCRHLLRREVFDRWGSSLCESAICASMKFYCPFHDCSVLLINDNEEVVRDAECPHCHRLFCAECKASWHVGIECDEYQRLDRDERTNEDLMLMEVAKNCKWQRCPDCRSYVERIDGCMFMTCRCGYQFCYGCASPMTIDHYCLACRR